MAKKPAPDNEAENIVAEENQEAAKADIKGIIEDVVSDVSPPSPVADMVSDDSLVDGQQAESSPTIEGAATSGAGGKRGRGRPRKAQAAGDSSPSRPRPKLDGVKQNFAPPPADMSTAGIEPCADIATMFVNVTGMALGGEEAAMLPQEQLMAKSGFVAYFKAKGIDNVPPWVVLTGALCPYYLRILTQTPARSKIVVATGRAWFGIKEFFKRRKNARSHSGHDSQRQDNAGAEAGEASGE